MVKAVDKRLSEITPYDRNPRRNDKAVDALVNSIREFGFKNPIILDKDNVIISGHTRYLAAMRMGLKTVPCIYADDLTDEQVRAFRLTDNRVQSFSRWDEDKLAEEISELVGFDMADFGFTERDVDISVATKQAEGFTHVRCPKCGHEWAE